MNRFRKGSVKKQQGKQFRKIIFLENEIERLTKENEELNALINKIGGRSRILGIVKKLDKVVDLGEPKFELPKQIPAEKKWNARAAEYKGLTPEEKATKYLQDNWMNYPATQNYFRRDAFHKHLERNNLLFLLSPRYIEIAAPRKT